MEKENRKTGRGGCLLCGQELVYHKEAVEMTRALCGRKEKSHAACQAGHYVCDACHEKKGLEAIRRICMETSLRDPIAIMQAVMEDPFIYMHGPEHHVMAGEELGVEMELPERIVCTFSGENRQCLRGKCPYYQG